MSNKKNVSSINEQIDKILYRSKYRINETPRYQSVMDDSEFDELPVDIYSTQSGMPVPNDAGSDAYLEEDNNNENIPGDDNAGVDELPGAQALAPTEPTEPTNIEGPANNQPNAEPPAGPPENNDINVNVDNQIPQPPIEPEKSVDELQNDIIKNNISAMKDLHDKLKELDSAVNNFSIKVDNLNKEVEEVKEPTNTEKLMSKKDVSYPYYFNLNDFWKSGSSASSNGEGVEIGNDTDYNTKGIKELPDGTFIADFDNLPLDSKTDIEDSFYKLT